MRQLISVLLLIAAVYLMVWKLRWQNRQFRKLEEELRKEREGNNVR